ncbi:hypothetical protein [Hyalangium rubrum]|uniref:Uncharacterized protein n=1 Tax=Hyalangium rubrum TaxID=3103134 RepID=A0ABU5H7E3_9BACT|nr:hypothetical protein [Hyalangium sp. s54d21]MDY7229401.1 hypothetical protein [Hyalangium sp. s54d21]
MKPLMMAALVVQLTSAGGAGSGQAGEGSKAGASTKDVGKHFSALKTEVTSLKEQFRQAKERARLDSERRKREEEGFYEPQTSAAAGAVAAPGANPSR